jgi:CheY-like chemotaxis protein
MSVVLLVEDDRELREMMTQLLDSCGISVRTASNGLAALMQARQEPLPRVVLLDLMMPVMDGWEFRRRQLADATIASIPVIVVSALSPVHYLNLEPAAVVPKPCDFNRLIEVVARFLKEPSPTRVLRAPTSPPTP